MINALWKCSGKQLKGELSKSFPRANFNFSNTLLEDADYA